MANGKKPETVGEHIIALYGHITGLKRDVEDLRTDIRDSRLDIKEATDKSDEMHNRFEKRFDTITKWIIYGLGSTITILIGIAVHLMK